MRKLQNISFMRFISILIGLLLLIACARQGTPTGGPKDETPPRFLGATPDTLSTNVSIDLSEIRIDFDEFLILKDYNKNIIVSPPLASNTSYAPTGSPSRSIKIKLNESLEPNTTYNINFGNSIQDHNEGNILPYFQYVFSTGEYIDSLELKGKVKVSSVREQPKNLMVGLYKIDSIYNDSIILKQKPLYIGKANEKGEFHLNYLKEGKYQLIAFDDELNNMQYDFGKEKFGFMDQLIDLDDIFTKDLQIDLFDQRKNYKVGKAEQKGYGHILFRFEGEVDEVQIQPLNFEFTTSQIDYKPMSDSLNFWFNPTVDSIAESSKRLQFSVKHLEKVDTISLVYSNNQQHQLKLERIGKLEMSPERKPRFSSNYPIKNLDSNRISVFSDTLRLNAQIIPDSIDKHSFVVEFPIELENSYEITMYPEMLIDIFGQTNDTLNFSFKTKPRNSFGNLILKLDPKPEHPFWLQLLDSNDKILEEHYTQSSEFVFNYLSPEQYYFKILIDENRNGHWDNGDFFNKIQGEKAYVYPSMVNIRALWTIEEVWKLPIKTTTDVNEKTETLIEAAVDESDKSSSE